MEGRRVWHRIERAIDELQRTAPGHGGRKSGLADMVNLWCGQWGSVRYFSMTCTRHGKSVVLNSSLPGLFLMTGP